MTLPLCAAVSACASGPSPAPTYYQLARLASPRLAADGPQVTLTPLAAGPGLDRQELARRETPVSLRFAEQERWLAMPAELVGRALADALAASGHFSLVGYGGAGRADLLVGGTLLALEGEEHGASHGAHVALQLQARRPDGAVVWTLAIDARRDCAATPVALATTLGELLHEQLAPHLAGLAAAASR